MNKDKIYGTIAIIVVMLLLFVIAWTFNIVPEQLRFDGKCEKSCGDLGWDTYETKFRSLPWNNLNGKCFCKDITKREFVFEVKDE